MAAILVTNGNQGVNLGATAVLSGSVLKYKSSKTGTPNDIVYTVTGQAQFGVVMRGTTIIPSGGTFTQAELDAGAIRFRSDPSGIVNMVYLGLSVRDLSDPSAGSVAVSVPIKISIPPMPPHGSTFPLTVVQDKTATVQQANINFNDVNAPDAWNQIIHEVQVLPLYGTMSLNGKKMVVGTKFTQDDVNKGRLVYQHIKKINPEATEDHLLFTTRDLQNNYMDGINDLLIKIILIDLPLEILKNGPLEVDRGATGVIDGELLKAADEDDPDLTITYTVLTLPKFGTLKLNGVAVAKNATFTQADIDSGKLSYTADGAISTKDSFKYKVAHSKQVLDSLPEFPIIIKVTPNLPPKLVITPVPVDFAGSAVADEKYIKITDPEGLPATELTVEISVLPELGDLFVNGVKAVKGTKLTVDQLNKGAITYKHYGKDKTRLTDAFKIIVSDGENKVEGTVPIIIAALNDKPPYLTVNTILKVERTSTTDFNEIQLNFTDDDTSFDLVLLTITELPKHGTLIINGSPAVVGTNYAKSTWATVSLRYVADNVAPTVLNDSFFFSLEDANNVVPNLAFSFKFPDIPVGCPEIKSTTAFCPKMRNVIITPEILSFSDVEVPLNKLNIVVEKQGNFGYLAKNSIKMLEGSFITATDIQQGLITYVNTLVTDDNDKIEISLFNGGCKINSVLNVEFLKSLRLVVNNDLYLSKGESKAILGGTEGVDQNNINLLYVSKDIPNPANIIYTKEPGGLSFGTLTVSGSESLVFTQDDLNNRRVEYNHNDSLTENDMFNFQVTDGVESLYGTLLIHISLPDEEPVLINNGMKVGNLLCRTIEVAELFARDRVSPANKLIFTVNIPPQFGTLSLGGVPLAANGTFTAADIQSRALKYCHTTEGEYEDDFDFTLTDEALNEITGKFLITIIPPPPPELRNNVLDMAQCSSAFITTSYLMIENLPTAVTDTDVVFTINTLPETVILMVRDEPAVVGTTITQDEINGNKLVAKHPDMSTGEYTFDFSAVAGNFNFNRTFVIKVAAGLNPPWVCVNTGMVVKERQSKTVDIESLQMCDVDLDSDVGDILPPLNQVNISGNDNKTFYFSVTPNIGTNLLLTVLSGSVIMEIRDVTGKVVYSTGCRTTNVVTTFIPPQFAYDVAISFTTGCAGSAPAEWQLGTL